MKKVARCKGRAKVKQF